MLRLAALAAGYAAGQVSGGPLGPGEAECAVWQAADVLAEVVMELRELARVEPGERREAAVALARLGLPPREIASRLGITDSTARKYLRPRSPGR